MTEEYRKFIFSDDITKPLDLEARFGKGRRIEIDIGCGMGRFILARAAAHPEIQFIGIERLKPRVEKIARKAWRQGLTNIFIIRLEATYVLRYLIPEHSVSRCYLFFPDPWPKRRHAGHRVFNGEFRSLVWSRLITGGDLQVATDSEDYFSDMERQMATDTRYQRVPAIERPIEQRTDFELIFLGQGLHPQAAGFQAKSPAEIGDGEMARYAKEDQERLEAFWNEEMPHAESVHIVGIGGVGMSAIAQAYLDIGAEVTGSDRLIDHGDMTPTLQTLAQQGVKLFPQNGTAIGDVTTKVIVSTAIENDNPDILAANERGVEIIHRSQALGELIKDKRVIAVAGTSGKSTTTAILGWILTYAGLNPTVINGAAIVGWDEEQSRIGSVRKGEGEWCVIEADESDRSLLRYSPELAIVTNESPDHFDIEETHRLFAQFKSNVTRRVIEGLPEDFKVVNTQGWKTRFHANGTEWSIALPGEHNCSNGWQAAEAARAVGVSDEIIRRALLTFPGVERRLQRIGKTSSGTLVIDDYGHNPAKLSAAISTVSKVASATAVLWRPHGYRPLRTMLESLADAFSMALRATDRLILLPVYDAGGTADRSIQTEALLAEVTKRGFNNVVLVQDIDGAHRQLSLFAQEAGDNGAILICGARDPDLPRLAKGLTQE